MKCSIWIHLEMMVNGYPLANSHNYGKITLILLGQLFISMAMFISYVELPDGIWV